MARARHYCRDCQTHFRVSPRQHADTAHQGGLFRGIVDGTWRDWRRRQHHYRDPLE